MTTALRITASSVLALVTSLSAHAGQQNCSGTITHLWVKFNGNVYIRPSYLLDHMRVCNLTADTNGVSATTCVAWLSILKGANQRQVAVNIAYYDAATTPVCNALATYDTAPMPLYIMQTN